MKFDPVEFEGLSPVEICEYLANIKYKPEKILVPVVTNFNYTDINESYPTTEMREFEFNQNIFEQIEHLCFMSMNKYYTPKIILVSANNYLSLQKLVNDNRRYDYYAGNNVSHIDNESINIHTQIGPVNCVPVSNVPKEFIKLVYNLKDTLKEEYDVSKKNT